MTGDKMPWIGGEHAFALNMGQVEALQDATGVGLEALFNRFATGDYKQRDVLETVRQGLIGGGLDAKEANDLTFGLRERGLGLWYFKEPAQHTINNALMNKPDDFLGKSVATTEAPQPIPPESGNSAESMVPEPS